MAVVPVELPHHRYDVTIEAGALARLGEIARAAAPAPRCALLSDERVFGLHGGAALDSLAAAGYDAVSATLPVGEGEKHLGTVQRLYDVLLEHRLERRSPVVALGGGVTGDTAGFAAATYLRGVPFVQCPTTLLAMVDSSVGGKVGVNVPQGKNLIGAFHQPVAVVIDPHALRTLPPREIRCGLAECIKHGLIRDASLFDFIAEHLDSIQALEPARIVELVRRNVEIKAAVVAEDEREAGVRAHLNCGHTFGHAIETTAGYGEFLHGEAVGLGLIAATRLALELGLCDAALLDRVSALVGAVGLPVTARLPSNDALREAMALDKKVADGRVRFVLPDRMGHVVIRDDAEPAQVDLAWSHIRA